MSGAGIVEIIWGLLALGFLVIVLMVLLTANDD